MNEIEKAFEAGFRTYREAFDHYDDSDETVEHSLKWRMAQYVAAQPAITPDDLIKISMQNEIADALRELIAEIYIDCKGAYGAGEDRYSGEYEMYIQKCAKAIVNAK